MRSAEGRKNVNALEMKCLRSWLGRHERIELGKKMRVEELA